jgi:hypothetical protein
VAHLVEEEPAQVAGDAASASSARVAPQQPHDATEGAASEALPEPLAGEGPRAAPVPPAEVSEATSAPAELTLDWVRGNWPLILMKIKPRSSQVRALLNSAYPIAVKGNTITLGCEANFHREKLDEEKKRGLVEGVCSEVLSTAVRVECRVQSDLRDVMRADEMPQTSSDMFEAKPAEEALREKLLNHPTVRALQERGGRISKISLYDEDETGG